MIQVGYDQSPSLPRKLQAHLTLRLTESQSCAIYPHGSNFDECTLKAHPSKTDYPVKIYIPFIIQKVCPSGLVSLGFHYHYWAHTSQVIQELSLPLRDNLKYYIKWKHNS